MLTRRIIACLDITAGRVVKGRQFVDLRDAGDPAELAARYAEQGADEIVLLDIGASAEGRATLLEAVRCTAAAIFVPFTVGRGIQTIEDAARVFDCGADKVSLNSAALANPQLITAIARRFGSQAVVVAIDAIRRNGVPAEEAEVWIKGGRQITQRAVVEWAMAAVECGAGELLLTSIDRDGTCSGFDCPLTAAVAQAVPVPVIASGGGGLPEHFAEVFRSGHADAAQAASIFHFGMSSVRGLKQELARDGVPVRLPC